ncbi:FBXL4 protein, partial [Acromyrmex insinuator]
MIILRKLDLRSLCRMSGVNKRFNNLAQNHLLYTSVNLEPYYWIMNIQAFHYLAPRCKYLRRLNFSNCVWISDHVGTFLVSYGSLLTHLKLAHLSIDNNTILTISEICKSLKELHLFNCYSITDVGFSYLENLKFLEYLNVGKTHITTKTLCKILRRNIRMRHLLILGTYDNLLNADEVVIELRNSCPDLESIKLGFMIIPIANNFTSKGINAFADCKNLRGVHLDWCYISGDSFFRVFSSCQHLERVFLSNIKGLTERDLRALTLCKNLKVLHLTCISMLPEICSAIFMNCHKLETVHFNRCNIADYLIVQWQQKYTRITIRAEKWPRPVESYIKTLITSLT